MKAVVKPEFVGHSHPRYGRLLADVVYEVDQLGELFDAYKEPKKAPKADEEKS